MALKFGDVFKSLNVAFGIEIGNKENNENSSDKNSINCEGVSKNEGASFNNSTAKVYTNLDSLPERWNENEDLSYDTFCKEMQPKSTNVITDISSCELNESLDGNCIDFVINSSTKLSPNNNSVLVDINEGETAEIVLNSCTYVVRKENEVVQNEVNEVTPNEVASENTLDKKKMKIVAQDEKLSRDKAKHRIQPPCNCTKDCIKKISQEARVKIHERFWCLNYDQRAIFIAHRMSAQNVQRREGKGIRNRRETHKYSFITIEGDLVEVCQRFFLATLGFTSNRILVTISEKCRDGILTSGDQRGKSAPSNKFSVEKMEDIRAHILSYDPRKPHYRGNHAPKRLYLPAELSIAKMHRSYLESGEKCSTETYRKEVVRMNISFAKLGHEECEDCLEYDHHDCFQHKTKKQDIGEVSEKENLELERDDNDDSCSASQHKDQEERIETDLVPKTDTNGSSSSSKTETDICSICEFHEDHIEKAKQSRIRYKEDALEVNTSSMAYYSVDLQKVTMLPHLPGVKTVAFTKRIIAYNETFAPLGDKKVVRTKAEKPTAVSWHQAEGGRSAQEISTTFIKFLSRPSNRDVENFTFWADNSSAQNKCWYLYSTLCMIVNSNQYPIIKSITVKYFERGHSFMSADSYHHLVEKGIREQKNVYDYQEYVDILQTEGVACILNSEDFLNVPRGVSEHSKFTEGKPMLDQISVAKFERESSKLFWKEDFTEQDFRSSEFLQKKIAAKVLTSDLVFQKLYPNRPPGITASRKNGIIKNLLPVIPDNRKKFWLDLTVATEVEDEPEDEDEALKLKESNKRKQSSQSAKRKSRKLK